MQIDHTLDTLLEMHDTVYAMENGYWMKFEAWRVEVTEMIPHGIRYSLTLHDKYGKRMIGYDNSHSVKPPKKYTYAGQRLTYDHKHSHSLDKGVPYEFKDAAQLLADFFAEVDSVLKELKK
ncbi:MAG: DUF6516 family protein [Pseudomonadota bacterium]